MKDDGKIHISGRKIAPNEQGVVRLSQEATEILADIANKSDWSFNRIVSEIIVQSVRRDLITFDR